MNRFCTALIAVFFAIGLTATPAMAASTAPLGFAPLQAAHTGTWYDPSLSGEGFDIWTFPDANGALQAFVVYFGGATPNVATTPKTSLPIWFFTATPWSGTTTGSLPLVTTKSILGQGTPDRQDGPSVGSIVFTAADATCTAITAEVSLGAPFHTQTTYHLVPLVQPNRTACSGSAAAPVFSNVQTCLSPSNDFSQATCSPGFSTQAKWAFPSKTQDTAWFQATIAYNGETAQAIVRTTQETESGTPNDETLVLSGGSSTLTVGGQPFAITVGAQATEIVAGDPGHTGASWVFSASAAIQGPGTP